MNVGFSGSRRLHQTIHTGSFNLQNKECLGLFKVSCYCMDFGHSISETTQTTGKASGICSVCHILALGLFWMQ